MQPVRFRKLFLLILLVVSSSFLLAQDDEDWDDEEGFVQLPLGLTAVYETLDGETLLERMESVPRLFGGKAGSIHPKVPPGAFRVTWRGRLLVPYDGDYTFRFTRSTLRDVKFTLYGKPVRPGEPVELEFGNVPLELSGVHSVPRGRRHRGGRPEFELAWEHEVFVRETLHPRFFGHLPAAAKTEGIVGQAWEDSGAALAESFGCFRCHEGPDAWVDSLAEGIQPEVLLPGPRLMGTGRRVHRAWLENYLTDPAAHRPGTRMPAQLTGGAADRPALKTIVAYLGSGQTAELAGASPDGSAASGQKLFDAHGCAACHEPPEGSIVAAGVSLRIPSLDRLAEKWTAGGLTAFLQSPLVDRPHGRMPDFTLSNDDAGDLAAYLLTRDLSGKAPQFVALPKPKHQIETDARSMVDPAGCLVLLSLDESAGELSDRSGNGHAGLPRGKLTYGRPGHDGSALAFGKKAHVVIEGSQRFDINADFTWTAWIRTKGDGTIVAYSREEGGWESGGKTLFVGDGRLCFDVGWVGVLTSETRVADDRWHHVAVTAKFNTRGDSDTVVLYIDGKADATDNDWDVDRRAKGEWVLKIGRTSTSFPQNHSFRGLIDDVTAWSRALEESEIAALGQGDSYLAETEAALFTPQELKSQWVALGEDPKQFDRLATGMRLRAVAMRQMAAAGCLNCHDAGMQSLIPVLPGNGGRPIHGSPEFAVATQPVSAPSLVKLSLLPEQYGQSGRPDAGCLAAGDNRGKAPRFDFSEDERNALWAYVDSLASRSSSSLPEGLAVDMKLLNCTACHDNEGHGSEPLTALLGGMDQAQFILPHSLTGVAGRLRAERLDRYLREGARNEPVRPWIGAKMPGFGLRGGRVARELCIRDRVSLPPPPGEEPDRDRAAVPQNQIELGRLLVTNKGLTCMNCHAMNGQQPSGEVDPSTRSPDMAVTTEHIRRDYFDNLLRNPERIFPGTKMPAIIPKDGPAPVPALAELPKEMLIQSLWNYLSLGERAPKPLEEDPTEALPGLLRMYVQRGPTYVGKELFGRGINCGSPTGTVLFDADVLEPGAIWFEGFLNRVPTNYFGLNWRAPEPHELLCDGQHSLAYRPPGVLPPEGGPWQVPPRPLDSDPNTGSRFDGYTLGRSDVEFRYRLALAVTPQNQQQIPVTDTLRIDHRPTWRGLVRVLTVEGLPGGSRIAWTVPKSDRYEFFTAAGTKVDAPGDAAEAPVVVYRTGDRVHAVRVEADPGAAWQDDGGTMRLLAPTVSGGQPVRFRIDRWTYHRHDTEPSAEELACLSDPAKLQPAPRLSRRGTPLPEGATAKTAAAVIRPVAPAQSNAESNGESNAESNGESNIELQPEEPFSYKFEQIPGPPEGWRPSGTAFTSDGMIYACGLTEGKVYRAKIPPVPAPEDFQWELFAGGMNVSTGMAVVDDRVFVAHRPEITELLDRDGDGSVEEFRTVTGPWSLKDGFHEYAFGLAVDPQKRFYVALNNGYFWSYGGPTNRGRYRSSAIRVTLDGHSEEWGRGCRAPDGIACGPGGQAFFVDNQGDWIQVCKLVHCRKGVFYGHPETKEEFVAEGKVPSGLPAIWIPYNVIRSAAALCYDETGGKFGPFTGQMFTGDCGYGQSVNFMRMALEKVDGVYQGAAFRFHDGPPRGPQHACFGPDGHLYVSCLTDGLLRLRYGGKVPMEIHHVSLRRDNRGFTLHFTKPIAEDAEVTPKTIRARRWWYPYGIRYGSPRHEEVDVPISAVKVAADRKSIDVTLPIKTYKNCIVYYLNVGKLKSVDGEPVEHPEAWYTIQRLWK